MPPPKTPDLLAEFFTDRVSDLLAVAALAGEVSRVEVPAALRDRIRAAAMVWAVEMTADLRGRKS